MRALGHRISTHCHICIAVIRYTSNYPSITVRDPYVEPQIVKTTLPMLRVSGACLKCWRGFNPTGPGTQL